MEKKKSNVWLTIIGIIFIIIGVGIAVDGIRPNSNTKSVNSSVVENTSYMTLEKFNKIQIGMTYEEVVSIVGSEGTLSSEASAGNITTKMYYWYAKNKISNAVISFTNGKVDGKTQIGL